MGRWIGIDYGSRRIGLAVSDYGGTIASPLETLPARGDMGEDARRVLTAAQQHEADGLVVGWPVNMDGSAGPQARVSEQFAATLRRRTRLPVALWDERLSSYRADELLDQRSLSAKQRKSRRDAVAAQCILQGFLDARRADRDQTAAEDPE